MKMIKLTEHIFIWMVSHAQEDTEVKGFSSSCKAFYKALAVNWLYVGDVSQTNGPEESHFSPRYTWPEKNIEA